MPDVTCDDLLFHVGCAADRTREERDYYRGYYDALMYVKNTYKELLEKQRKEKQNKEPDDE